MEKEPALAGYRHFGGGLMNRSNRIDHIRLTSHPDPNAKVRFPIYWGAPSAHERGPIIGTVDRRIATSLAVMGGRMRSIERLQCPQVRSIRSGGRI